jgi:hypothetical protein
MNDLYGFKKRADEYRQFCYTSELFLQYYHLVDDYIGYLGNHRYQSKFFLDYIADMGLTKKYENFKRIYDKLAR